jgi:hypothetical protein
MTPQLGLGEYHYTRCALDGGAEAIERVPEPPAPGRRRIRRLAVVVPLKRNSFRMQLCSNPFAQLPPAPLEPRLERWSAIVGRPRVARRRVLVGAPRRSRRRVLRPAWRRGWLCPQTECRYHLSDFGGAPSAPGCALIIAASGAHTLHAIGMVTGFTRERIRQIIAEAVQRKGLRELREFAPDDTGTGRRPLDFQGRVLRLLSAGSATTGEIAAAMGVRRDSVRETLHKLEADGAVVARLAGWDGIEWRIAEHETDAGRPCQPPPSPVEAMGTTGCLADSPETTAAEVAHG